MRLFLALFLAACSAGCSNSPVSKAVLDIAHVVVPGEARTAVHLNPAFRYLRVQIADREVYFALGYVDPTPEGMVEVWYSAGGEVLRLRDGRLVGVTGMKSVWTAVHFEGLPDWDGIGTRAAFVRLRDVSPGYRYGLREAMNVYPIAVPSRTHLKNLIPGDLAWFEEISPAASYLPPVRYAVQSTSGKHEVIYSEICLDGHLCFSWQRWHG